MLPTEIVTCLTYYTYVNNVDWEEKQLVHLQRDINCEWHWNEVGKYSGNCAYLYLANNNLYQPQTLICVCGFFLLEEHYWEQYYY